jgi:hypothetical protein
MNKDKLTVSAGHGFMPGERIGIPIYDARWFVVAWCWLRRKPIPSKEMIFMITGTTHDTLEIIPLKIAELEANE